MTHIDNIPHIVQYGITHRNSAYAKLDYVDMDSVRARYWNDEFGVSDVKRRKQAEFLSTEDVAQKHILGYGCYNQEAKNKLLGYGIPDNKILINPNCYF